MRVTIEAGPMERGLHRQEQDALDAELVAAGFLVERPPLFEERGVPTQWIDPDALGQAVKFTLEHAADLLVIEEIVRRCLKARPRRGKRIIRIYDQSGNVLSTVEREAEDDADSST